MKKTLRIFSLLALLLITLTAVAQKSEFRPISYAIISQTIAPDARSAGMGDIGAATDGRRHYFYFTGCKRTL